MREGGRQKRFRVPLVGALILHNTLAPRAQEQRGVAAAVAEPSRAAPRRAGRATPCSDGLLALALDLHLSYLIFPVTPTRGSWYLYTGGTLFLPTAVGCLSKKIRACMPCLKHVRPRSGNCSPSWLKSESCPRPCLRRCHQDAPHGSKAKAPGTTLPLDPPRPLPPFLPSRP